MLIMDGVGDIIAFDKLYTWYADGDDDILQSVLGGTGVRHCKLCQITYVLDAFLERPCARVGIPRGKGRSEVWRREKFLIER